MRSISRFCVRWSLISASMQGLAFMVFNCSILRFVVVIALVRGLQVWGNSYRQLSVLLRSQDILLSSQVGSFVGRGFLYSVRIVLVLCTPTPGGQTLGTGSIFSLLPGRVPRCRYVCVLLGGHGPLSIPQPRGCRTRSPAIRACQLLSLCLF